MVRKDPYRRVRHRIFKWILCKLDRVPDGESVYDRVGVALAFSAAVELAYTFFTDGPDEALDPLILGISGFTLILASQSRWLDAKNLNVLAIPVLLLTLSIFILFLTKKYLLEVRKGEAPKKDEPPPGTYLG